MELVDDVSHGILIRSIWRQCQFWCKIGAQFVPNALQSKKPFLTHLFVLLDEEAQVEARFGLFGDSANLDARQVHGLHGTYHMHGNQFGSTRRNSLMTCVKWNLALVCLETVLVSVQDMCTVCIEHTKCLEINLDAHDGARQVHGLHGTYHMLGNQFGCTRP